MAKCALDNCDNEATPAYFELEATRYCTECNLREAQEMAEFFMSDCGQSKRQAIRQIANSKGDAFAQKVSQRMTMPPKPHAVSM